MGSQQLLMAVVGMVIVGIAIVVAITMFQANAIESSRNALISDLSFYAGRAREYYMKPANLGGGSHDFSGITIRNLAARSQNDNGRYYVESTERDEIVLVGIGWVVSSDGDTISVRMRVNERTNIIEILH
jgi:hypothetical protein